MNKKNDRALQTFAPMTTALLGSASYATPRLIPLTRQTQKWFALACWRATAQRLADFAKHIEAVFVQAVPVVASHPFATAAGSAKVAVSEQPLQAA